SPEADERAVPECEVDRVLGPYAEAPQPVAPHLANPVPILGAVEHAYGSAPRGARREVVANGVVRLGRDDIAEERLLDQRLHPLLARHEGYAPQVGNRF